MHWRAFLALGVILALSPITTAVTIAQNGSGDGYSFSNTGEPNEAGGCRASGTIVTDSPPAGVDRSMSLEFRLSDECGLALISSTKVDG